MRPFKRIHQGEENSQEDWDEVTLPNKDSSAFCRLCFSITQLEPIFNNPHDTNPELTGLIEQCTAIKLRVYMDYPCSICRQCYNKLLEFQRFRNLSQSVNSVVRRTMNQKAKARRAAIAAATISTAAPGTAIPAAATENTSQEAFYIEELSEDEEVEYTGTISLGQEASKSINPSTSGNGEVEIELPYVKINDWYCCKGCSKIFKTIVTVMEHIREKHPELTKSYYLAGAIDQSIVEYSVKDVDIEELLVGEKRYYKCDQCDTLFSQKRNIARHRWRYHGAFNESKIYCAVLGCNCFFMDSKAHRRHMVIVHNEPPKRRIAPQTAEVMQYESVE